MKKLITSLIIICIVLFWGPPEVLAYSGGSGTETDPFQIASANDLLMLAGTDTDYDKYFILTVDIDLEGLAFTTAIIAADAVGSSSSFEGTAFTGTFDGNNHKITHSAINGGTNYHIGLFGYIDSDAEVKNLGLKNFVISSDRFYVGGLVGRNLGNISNCYMTGNVFGLDCVGGLVGINHGNISNCYSTGEVSGDDKHVGGLAGYNYGSISDCYATGNVSGLESTGGLVGYNKGGISNSYAACYVFSRGYMDVGGLVGQNWGSISNCYTKGSTRGNDFVGGLVGYNQDSSITNCYTIGNVRGDGWIGGLVGRNYSGYVKNCYSIAAVNGSYGVIGGLVGLNWKGSIINCYSTGNVSGGFSVGGLVGGNESGSINNCYSTSLLSGHNPVGGLVAYNYYSGIIRNSFWDIQTSGQTTSAGGIGKTTAEMQTKSTFTDADWDFNTPIWEICSDTNDYPHLWWEYYYNIIPVAVAGPNQVIYVCSDDELADVTLDGSGSYDDNNDILDYYWSWYIDSNLYEANGVSPTIQLPMGEYEIELIVDDGIDESEPNYCTITVIEPLHVKMFCIPRFLNTQSRRGIITAFVYMPDGITPEDIDANEPLLFICDSNAVESTRQFVRQWNMHGRSRTWVLALFDKDECMDILSPGFNRIKVAGRLNSGRCYYGNCCIYVYKPRPFRRWWTKPRH